MLVREEQHRFKKKKKRKEIQRNTTPFFVAYVREQTAAEKLPAHLRSPVVSGESQIV